MSKEYIKQYYGVDVVKGRMVTAHGKNGVITGTEGQYVKIRFDGVKHAVPVHPTDFQYMTEILP